MLRVSILKIHLLSVFLLSLRQKKRKRKNMFQSTMSFQNPKTGGNAFSMEM
jgi:hypothetical protein